MGLASSDLGRTPRVWPDAPGAESTDPTMGRDEPPDEPRHEPGTTGAVFPDDPEPIPLDLIAIEMMSMQPLVSGPVSRFRSEFGSRLQTTVRHARRLP